MSEVIEDEFRLDEWSRTQEAKNGETIKMITKEEVIKAWGTILLFCTEQDHCASCPMVLGCITRFGTKSLETCASEFINTMR